MNLYVGICSFDQKDLIHFGTVFEIDVIETVL